jgi:hypothetical protein
VVIRFRIETVNQEAVVKRVVLGVVALVLLAGVPASAHHAFGAMYDGNKPITLKGKVTKVEWMNPHIYYYIDAPDVSGKVMNWAIEGGTPAGLQRRGVPRNSLKVGDTITVEGFMARDGSNHINGRNVTFADGRRVFAGANDGAPEFPGGER